MHLWLYSHIWMARNIRLPEIGLWTRPWCLHSVCTVSCSFYTRNWNVSGLYMVKRNTFVSVTRTGRLQNGCPCVILRDLKIYLWCCFRVQWPWHTTLLYMTLPIWKQTMCSNWHTSCVTCTATGLALSEFLFLARWVVCRHKWLTRMSLI
jgi:hypothetical protein